MCTNICLKFAIVINSAAGHGSDSFGHPCYGSKCLNHHHHCIIRRHIIPCPDSYLLTQFLASTQSSTTDPPTPLLPENDHLTTSSLLHNLTTTHTFTYHPSTTNPFITSTSTTHLPTTSTNRSQITTTLTAHSFKTQTHSLVITTVATHSLKTHLLTTPTPIFYPQTYTAAYPHATHLPTTPPHTKPAFSDVPASNTTTPLLNTSITCSGLLIRKFCFNK